MSARWEWRSFGAGFGAAEDRLAEHARGPAEESDDRYLLSEDSDASVKARSGLMDVKHLLAVDDDGLEQWTPVMKAPFPLAAGAVRSVFDTLRVAAPPLERSAYTQEQLFAEVAAASPDVRALDVHKRRLRATIGGCMAEVSEMITEGGSTRTIAIEAEDPAAVKAAVEDLGLDPRLNTCMARGLKALAGIGAHRYAVIDVGTNSVKFHIGERRGDGRWRTIVDRAEVTRLGEGLQATGALSPAPIERTVAAIFAMADEARRNGAETIAAVGTAGLRIAPNASDLLEAAASRCGVRIEVIPGEEEARLAYLAATAGIASGGGSRVVFDTGGGSSQFTFGAGDRVEERFSVQVGAARFTEQFGLSGAVSESTLDAALAAIAADLARLNGRPAPDAVIGMGGAVTNLAAVQLTLAEYDGDVVQGTVLARDEIDRQIELYRTRSAQDRREIVGLQPARAEVILAGACIVRSVLGLLRSDSLTVSDRGLRHGLLLERFAQSPRPVGTDSTRSSTAPR